MISKYWKASSFAEFVLWEILLGIGSVLWYGDVVIAVSFHHAGKQA